MHPRFRRSAACGAALLLLGLAGCESDGGGNQATPAAPESVDVLSTPDNEGDLLADGALKIVRIDRSRLKTEGVVAYVVKNVSSGPGKDFVWSVTFQYDPPKDTGEIRMPVTLEPTDEFSVYLVSEDEERIEIKSGAFDSRPKDESGGRGVRSTRMSAYRFPPRLAIARGEGMQGTLFVGGDVECVGLSSLWDDPTQLVVSLQNISNKAIPDNRYQLVVIMDESETRSDPVPLPGLAPGQTVKVTADLSKVVLGTRSYKLQVIPRKIKT